MIRDLENRRAAKRLKSKVRGGGGGRTNRRKSAGSTNEGKVSGKRKSTKVIAAEIPVPETLCEPIEPPIPLQQASEGTEMNVSADENPSAEATQAGKASSLAEDPTSMSPLKTPDVEVAVESPVTVGQENCSPLQAETAWRYRLPHMLKATWNWIQQRMQSQQSRKRLRVCETVSLGEKRFVAVIQVDGEQFLVAGSSSSVSTLARLEKTPDFSEVFGRNYQQDSSQA